MAERNFPNRPFRLRENVWLKRQDIAGNSSLMGWELWIHKNSYSPTSSDGITHRRFSLDGAERGSTYNNGFDFRGDGPWLILSGESWIGHNADGTKNLPIYGWANYDILGQTDVNSGLDLPRIARASRLTFLPDEHSGIFGQYYEMRSNRASDQFQHDSDYYFGNASGRSATAWLDAAGWTPPMDLLNEISQSLTGVGIMRLYTYTGGYGTFIGSIDTHFRLTAPASLGVDFTNLTISETNTAVSNALGAGVYVQGISKIKAVLNGAVSSGYLATIPSNGYWLAMDGQTINAQTGIFAPPVSAGTIQVSGSVTDTRSLSKNKAQTINVLAYNPPTINSVKIERALSTGVVDEQAGTFLKVTINAAIKSLKPSTVEKNTLRYRISTRVRGATSWTLRTNTVLSAGTTSMNSAILVNGGTGGFPITASHEVMVEIVDIFSTSVIQQTVGVAKIAQHWDGNRGIGIGKFRENGMLDVAGDIYQAGSIVTPVGSMLIYPSTAIPAGYMRPEGQALSRITYSALYALIGTVYGSGDGSTTFNLPDIRGRVIVALNNSDSDFTLTTKGGVKSVTLTVDQMPQHNHDDPNTATLRYAGDQRGNGDWQGGGNRLQGGNTIDRGGNQPHTNLQPYIALSYIMRVI